QGRTNGDTKDDQDRSEGEPRRDRQDASEEHLRADDDEDCSEAVGKILEAREQALDEEEHGPQTEDGEDVRRHDDDRVRRDGKDGWDRVDGEDDVRDQDRDDGEKEWGRIRASPDLGRETIAVEAIVDRQPAVEEVSGSARPRILARIFFWLRGG